MSAERDTRRPSRLDPDELAALEEQRDFLLRSITDLDQEHAAGDLEDGDYQSLKDDYTARAAEVLRAIEQQKQGFAQARRPRSAPRTAMIIAGVLAFGLVAGWAVARPWGRERPGTPSPVASTSSSHPVSGLKPACR